MEVVYDGKMIYEWGIREREIIYEWGISQLVMFDYCRVSLIKKS